MSTNDNPTEKEKLTETIRGRVEPSLKERAQKYGGKGERSESYVVRRAVTEFLDRHEKRKTA